MANCGAAEEDFGLPVLLANSLLGGDTVAYRQRLRGGRGEPAAKRHQTRVLRVQGEREQASDPRQQGRRERSCEVPAIDPSGRFETKSPDSILRAGGRRCNLRSSQDKPLRLIRTRPNIAAHCNLRRKPG